MPLRCGSVSGEVVTQSAVPLRIGAAVEDACGEVIDADARIGWLLDLVEQLSAALMQSCWQPGTFTTLHAGVDAVGRKLPARAAVVAARLGWAPVPPAGVYVPSRVVRLAQANVVPVLKTLAFRDALIPQVLAALDKQGRLDPQQLSESQGRYVSSAFLQNLCRQLRRAGGGPVTSITDIQDPPTTARMARLGAADRQLVELDSSDPAGVWLRLKLPACRAPAGRSEWSWWRLWCPTPPHLKDRDIACWHPPTISMVRGKPLLRFTITETVPEPATAAATAALGIDWSPASLGAATMVADLGGQLVTDAATLAYDDRGLGVRLTRLQAEGQALTGKIARLSHLAVGAPEPTQARLSTKIGVLQQNRRALGAKRQRINRDMAFDFAATMTAMATGSGAGVIAVEDLRDLEARGHGRVNNNRAAQSARRRAVAALEHTAAKAGLEVVMCPPRGTSAHCPSCDQELTRPGGYHTATCTPCGIHGANRDQIAGQNIAKRVLLAKTKVKRPKGKPKRVTVVKHQPVRKTRQKTTATPKQRRHKRTRHSIAITPARTHQHPMTFPARTASVWDRDQQPTPVASTSAPPIPDTRDTPLSASVRDR
jgi:Putative transposase DNA-binding domain